ncbi:hypothetical protein KSS87_023870 [Heliosperma pusillum]|nr:hypothetical protein KSS87_013906 [Heliosperma pusillum]KAH9625157.1 hypothetical protein KSS87_023870 [Heliosperma pusillum]
MESDLKVKAKVGKVGKMLTTRSFCLRFIKISANIFNRFFEFEFICEKK